MLNVPVLIAEEIHVPEDFDTIQEAIDGSRNGDVIIVHPGTYVERLNTDGKAITIGSLYLTTGDPAYIDSTIIDGDGGGNVVTIRSGEDEGTILTGLTIRNGSADYGGGFYINNTTPTLDHLLIMNNHAVRWGAGIYCTADALPTLINLTVAGNLSDIGNGGIHVFNGGSATIVNSIFWNNTPAARPGGMTVTYTDIQGGYAGAGNLDTDPLFEDSDNDLYHLTEDSPCIDAGDPDFDDDPDETRADIGAFYYDQPFEPDIFISPAALDFGDVELELSADLILTVSNVGRTELLISDVRIDNGVFTCDIENEVVIQPDDSLEITVTFTPEDLDVYQGAITITSDDPDEDEQVIAIPMTGTGAEPRDHVINVPEDYDTIQEAIDNALDTDTVLVQQGTYTENIDFSGKNIVVGSLFLTTGEFEHIENTIIDGDANNTSIVLFANGETEDAVLTGFTLTNGTADFGAAIQINGTDPTLDHLLIYGNSADRWGGGIVIYNGANPALTNLTVYGNDAGTDNGGLSVFGSVATVTSSIFWANEPPAIPANQTITFSDIQGGYVGDTNIDRDPQFADVDNDDFHLTWGSPCIDRGDPNAPNDPDDTRADMGVFYFHQADEPRIVVTPQALDFGEVVVDQRSDLILTISNVGRAALIVSNVSIAGDENFLSDFDDDLVIDQGDNRQLTVTFIPDAAADFNAVMTIFSNDTLNDELTVDMIGTGVAPIPEIEVNPAALDFGAVVVDRSADLILTIGNVGHGDLTVSNISIDGNVFSSDFDGEFILAPQERYQLTVTFTPDDVGDFAEVLTISSNDSANGELTVDLTGTGRDFLINVPGDYQTIGEAIDAAFDGDTVLVQDGVYTEIVNFGGKNIVVGSVFIMDGDTAHIGETIIDGDQNGRSVIVIRNGETAEAVLSGFTIRNADTDYGGGIYLNNSAPTLDHLIITGNHCSNRGSGIYATSGADPTISYVTIYGNVADDTNGGIGLGGGATATVINSIIYGNQPAPNSAGMTITYTDVEGGYAGEGNIDSDPLFTDTDAGDLSLTADSPCIDVGNPDSPEDPDRTRADMGALYFHQDIEDAPRIEVSPDTLDFGEVVRGQSNELILTISNTGNLDLNVIDITIVGETFLSDFGEAVVIEPNGSYEQTVTFAPEEIADFEGSLTIESNDPDNGELIVPLFGSGSSIIREVGVYDTPGSAEGVFVAAGYAYVADYWRGLCVVNVLDPSNPVESGSYDTPGEAYTLYVVGNYCYVADGGSGLQIIDISDPQNPDLISTVDTPGEAFGVFVSNGTAFVADLTGGLRIIDVSDPQNPEEIGSIDTPSRAYGVYVSGNTAYIADQDGGLRVIDVSDPENPEEIGYFETEGRTYAVYGVGDFVYLADAGSGMRLIDVSQPDNPREIGFLDTPGSAEGIFVTGDYAYVADGEEGLRVIDITDPDNLEEVGFRDTPDYCIGVFVSGSHAYVADEGSGLHIFDISFFVPPAPDIAVEPDSLDFGSILVNQPIALTLTISNLGDADLTISDITVVGQTFLSAFENEVILEPNSSFDLTVTFAPEEEGDFEGTLTIISDDPDEGEFAVPLHGIGFEPGRVLNVPDNYGTIQAAIDASVDTDTVLVQPGVYTENLNFNGKNIVVGSLFMTTSEFERIESTIIDGDANGRSVVVMRNGETNAAKLCGFTLRNSDTDFGGGLYINAADPTCDHLIIHSNAASRRGAGIYITAGASPVISHVTVSGNVAQEGIGGLDAFGGSAAAIVNSIFFGNTPAGMPVDQVITFSDVEDGYAGEGNIDADPLFADSDNDDYNLTGDSPCIDAGDPDADEDPDVTTADMGALYLHQEAVPDIVVEPDTLNFGDVLVGQVSAPAILTISNVGREDLTVRHPYVEHDYFYPDMDEWSRVVEPGNSFETEAFFAPGETGDFEATLIIPSDDPDEAEVTVYMFGTGIAPIIVVDPEALDFGEVVIDQTARLTLTISNIGTAELTISDITMVGQTFLSAIDGEVVIEPNESYDLPVSFTPPDEGEFLGTLTIHSNALNNDTLDIPLSGIGREPDIPLIGRYNTDGSAVRCFVRDNIVFVADDENGLVILDASDMDNIEEINQYDTPGSAVDLEVIDNIAYIANHSSGLRIIDISNLENLDEIGFYDSGGNTMGLHIVDRVAYLCDGQDGLLTVDISDLENPNLLDRYDSPSSARDISIYNQFAFITDWDGGVRVVNISDLENLREVANLGTENPAHDIDIVDNFAFVTTWEADVIKIDISDPGNPEIVGSFDTPGLPIDIDVVGNIAFVADMESGLLILDISDSDNIFEVGTYDTQGRANGVTIYGNYAYVSDMEAGLLILDVSDFVQYPDIEVSADSIDFGEVRVGQVSVPAILTIFNEGNWDLTVSNVTIEGDYFTSDFNDAVVIQPDGSIELSVNFAPDERSDYEATLTIFSDDYDEREVTVSLSGTGVAPDLVIDPEPIDFGEVVVGQVSVPAILAISNDGNSDLTISDISVIGEVFSTDFEAEFVIEPDGLYELNVTFEPPDVGGFEGSLTIFSDDPDQGETVVHLTGTGITPDRILEVPQEFGSIQEAIDSAEEGDTVLVSPRTYVENIDYTSKNITVASLYLMTGDDAYIASTVIDGDGNGIVVVMRDNLTEEAVLCGFTITNGLANYGAGIYINTSAPTLDHLLITGNYANRYGGGIYSTHTSNPSLTNITLVANTAETNNAGIHIYDNSSAQIVNSIFWGNQPATIANGLTVTYSDIEGGYAGDGNIDQDPLFYDFDAGDFRLTENSPCIDVGDPNSPDDPDESPADMGVFRYQVAIEPSIVLNPAAIDFGEVPLGQREIRTLEIGNEGNADLTISDITVEGQTFISAIEDEIVIEPNDTYNLIVEFAPEAAQDYAGTLTVHSNDPRTPQAEVDLSGIGREPELDEVGSIDTPGGAYGVFVVGNYAYIADRPEGIRIIDVSDPANPREVANQEIPDPAYEIVVVDGIGYVAGDQSGLRIIDLSDPENPDEIAFLDTPGYMMGVFVIDDIAYAADGPRGLMLIDISDPENPETISSIDTPEWAVNVHVVGDYAYIADGTNGLVVIDVSDPDNMEQVGSYNTPGLAVNVLVKGDYAYIGDETGGLRIIDVSDPTNPDEIGSFETAEEATGVFVIGNRAFLGEGTGGFGVVDISDPTQPERLALQDTPGDAAHVFISGNLAYVADGPGGLRIFDVTDVIPRPAIVLSTNDLDFEEVSIGRREVLTLTIGNEGDGDLIVDEISVAGEYFDVNFEGVLTIEPGGSYDQSVAFAPDDEGDSQGTLTVRSNDENNPELMVDLFGIGVNNPPEAINPIENIVIDEDSGLLEIANLDTVFDDLNGDEMSFTVDGPGELDLNITDDNILTLRPDDDFHADSLEVTVTADDERDIGRLVAVRDASERSLRRISASNPRRDATGTDLFLVTVTAVNDPPVWEDYPENNRYEVNEGDLAEFNLIAQDDVDNNVDLTIILADRGGLPDNVELNDNGDGTAVFTWQTQFDDAGEYHPRFTVTDDLNATVDLDITIAVGDFNRPPIPVKPIEDIVIPEDFGLFEVADLDTVFEDPDGDELTFRIDAGINELNLILDNETNILTLEPTVDYVGQSDVIIEADDGVDNVRLVMSGIRRNIRQVGLVGNNPDPRRDATATDEFTVTVTPVNDPPVIVDDNSEPMPDEIDEQIQEAERFRITFWAVDVEDEGDALVWSMPDPENQLPDDGWEFIDHEDGSAHFTFTPDFDDAGDYHPVFVVSDPEDDTDEITLNITVINVNRPPILVREIPDQEFDEDDDERLVAVLSNNFVDPDGDDLTFNDPPPDVEGLNIRLDGANLYITPDADWYGQVNVTIRASDEESFTEDTFTITVNPVNDPPIVEQPIEDIVIIEDSGLLEVADLDDVFEDPDGDELTFTVDGPAELNLIITDENILTLRPDDDFYADNLEVTVTADDNVDEGRDDGSARNLRKVENSKNSSFILHPSSLFLPNPRRDATVTDEFTVTVT
ncbi:choice-of-anchor D domain-containing protein, partial [bacterium]|nr:choice-of-anchor D domain-containing protein [bacterium]